MPDEPKYNFDVFVSYSQKDREWVAGTLLPRLEQAGVKVCIDFRNFKPGKAALVNMQDAVGQSAHTLLVMTPNWVDSEWTLYESILIRSDDPSGQKQRTIPLLFQPCDIPKFIAVLSYIDFTRPDREQDGWRMLLTACGKAPQTPAPETPRRDNWCLAHPYPMPPNFTGRDIERAGLTSWLDADPDHPLLVMRSLGGFGKSALAWHWLLNDVSPATWLRVVWWSFYEGDAGFENFLANTLAYLSSSRLDLHSLNPRQQLDMLLQALRPVGTLLILDGFERALRAYGGLNAAYQGDEPLKFEAREFDCISHLAELFLRGVATLPGIRAKVLLTTRLRPRAVEGHGGALLHGCREEELKQLLPADAMEFFHVQAIRGTQTEIEAACKLCGCHPLSLRLLAGLILGDPRQPGDIAVASRVDVSGDLIQHRHHVLETAYNSLTPQRQALLGRIACFRSPVSYDTLKALAEADSNSGFRQNAVKISDGSPNATASLDADIRDLVARGLLQLDRITVYYDQHPIVRHYAYDRLAVPDRLAAHVLLRDYFAAVPKPDKVTRVEDLTTVIELYHHTVRSGQFDEARTLYRDRLAEPLHFQLGAYQLIADLLYMLFPDGADRPPRLKDESAQGWTLNSLANSYSISGQPRRAVPLFEQASALAEKQGNKSNLAVGLENVAAQRLVTGALKAAEANLRHSIALGQEIRDEFREAVGHVELGRPLAYRGAYAESETELATALKMFEKQAVIQPQCVGWAYRALRELLLLRSASESATRNPQSAIAPARRALELADETARTRFPVERDHVRARWLAGVAHRVAGQHDEAERHLHEALERCRRINMVDHEADILIDLARLRAATGAPDEAWRLAEEALLITERSGYVLQGADAHLVLAQLALARGDKPVARHHANEARRLATCDGPPDHTYKAAYDEAGVLQKQLEIGS
jgi:tetratricopeptide (TPR) repeat protein